MASTFIANSFQVSLCDLQGQCYGLQPAIKRIHHRSMSYKTTLLRETDLSKGNAAERLNMELIYCKPTFISGFIIRNSATLLMARIKSWKSFYRSSSNLKQNALRVCRLLKARIIERNASVFIHLKSGEHLRTKTQ